MTEILNALKTNLLKEGVSLQNLKFKTYANHQILVKANGLELRITKKGEAFSVAIADEEGEFGSIVDAFHAIENAVEYSIIEIREMLNFPGSMKEMLFDCCHC